MLPNFENAGHVYRAIWSPAIFFFFFGKNLFKFLKGDKFIKFKEIDVLNFEKLAIILKYVYLSYHKTYELVPHVNNTSSFDIK